MNTPLPLILGSSSIFRQQQLRTLGLPFQTARPDFDEADGLHPNDAGTQIMALAFNGLFSLTIDMIFTISR